MYPGAQGLLEMLTVSGCDCRRDISPLIPPRLLPLEIAPHSHTALPGHSAGAYLGHRRPALGRFLGQGQEEILLRPGHITGQGPARRITTAHRSRLARDTRGRA
jgi:hypothetical protein